MSKIGDYIRKVIHTIKYAFGVTLNATRNMFRAGNNNVLWGTIGGFVVGAFLGTSILGNVVGTFVGGVIGSSISYFLSI